MGNVSCDSCDGRGTQNYDCDVCEGMGSEGCENCDGTGHSECGDCDGTGVIPVDEEGNEVTDCSTCGGSGKIFCPECGGEGRVECSYCFGQGTVESECSTCAGSGEEQCDNCGGSGKNSTFMDFYDTIKQVFNQENRPKALAQHASKKVAHPSVEYIFAVPNESAPHVAHHLATSGMLDFEVEPDERSGETYFIFNNNDDFEVAHEIVRYNFKRQIDAGRGLWALWKELEPVDNLERRPGRAMASKQAGAWGVKSYDNDSVHDILDKYRPKGIDGPIPEKNLQPLLDEMLTMVDTAHTPEDQARFFGVMTFLIEHDTKLDPTFKHLAIEIGRELAHNNDYLKMWDSPMARKLMIKRELELFGQPLSFAAAKKKK